MFGVIVGWLNPIEGPLDWTYDEYASQPAHKYPTKVAPIIKEEEVINPDEALEEEDILYSLRDFIPFILPPRKEEGENKE